MLRNFFMMALILAIAPWVRAASNANDVEGIPLPIPKDARTANTGVYGSIHPNYTPELDLTNTARLKDSKPVNVTVERVAIIPDPAFVAPPAVTAPAPQAEVALQPAPAASSLKVRSAPIPMPTPTKVEPVIPAIYVTAKSDQEMMNDIQNALNSRRGLSSFAQRVRLSANRGVITLRGLVNGDAEKSAIENLAASIVGSQHIQSQLYTAP